MDSHVSVVVQSSTELSWWRLWAILRELWTNMQVVRLWFWNDDAHNTCSILCPAVSVSLVRSGSATSPSLWLNPLNLPVRGGVPSRRDSSDVLLPVWVGFLSIHCSPNSILFIIATLHSRQDNSQPPPKPVSQALLRQVCVFPANGIWSISDFPCASDSFFRPGSVWGAKHRICFRHPGFSLSKQAPAARL